LKEGSGMNAAPIELNLYNAEDEVTGTLSRSRIPSYLLDMAIELQSKFADESNTQNADALFDFIVEFYGSKVDRETLKKQTDLIECMAVLRAIITRASGLALDFAKANPRGPSPKKR
jgi:hypothetical protein